MGNGMLSQEEIDALLKGTIEPEPEPTGDTMGDMLAGADFTDMEKDALGEIANICMGTAATTLSQLLGKKVEITTPKVDVTTSEGIRQDYPVPSVVVDVMYKAGIEGSNLLIISQRDGSIIVDLMMGGDGKNPSPDLSELQMSGISEAMNQMMGSAATSMSTMFSSMVDITPPRLALNDFSSGNDLIKQFLPDNELLVRVSFRMVVENVIDSSLVQIIPISVARNMVSKLLGDVDVSPATKSAPPQVSTPPVAATPEPYYSGGYGETGYAAAAGTPLSGAQGAAGGSQYGGPPAAQPAYSQVPYSTPPYGAPPPSYGGPTPQAPPGGGGYYPPPGYGPNQNMIVQPAQFAPLHPGQVGAHPDNLNLILDVPLQVSVELGRTKKTIKEILDMGPGSVLELDRLAGEPVDMIVNGKLIAKCEVVVINETFGIRITDIVNPVERMKTLN